MNLLGTEKLPSVINDPFKKTKVYGIHIWLGPKYHSKGGVSGEVEFKNGNTSGEQHFQAETFDELILQIKAMLDNLD